jgi:hypothetical protein
MCFLLNYYTCINHNRQELDEDVVDDDDNEGIEKTEDSQKNIETDVSSENLNLPLLCIYLSLLILIKIVDATWKTEFVKTFTTFFSDHIVELNRWKDFKCTEMADFVMCDYADEFPWSIVPKILNPTGVVIVSSCEWLHLKDLQRKLKKVSNNFTL